MGFTMGFWTLVVGVRVQGSGSRGSVRAELCNTLGSEETSSNKPWLYFIATSGTRACQALVPSLPSNLQAAYANKKTYHPPPSPVCHCYVRKVGILNDFPSCITYSYLKNSPGSRQVCRYPEPPNMTEYAERCIKGSDIPQND